ncbi:MAG: hypothetical protein AAFY31_12745, partial [Pseudomonadota bacterium]
MKLKRSNPVASPLRLLVALFLATGAVALNSTATYAQDGVGTPPENAQKRSYGSGWNCNIGYRVNDGICIELDIPENAYATGRSYGTGWACRRGFEEMDGKVCVAIFVPENAFLRSSGYDWQCHRGFRQDRESCVEINVPEHAYLIADNSGNGWECNRGFVAVEEECRAIAVPENGYLTNAEFGEPWKCEPGFVRAEERCERIGRYCNEFASLFSSNKSR